MKLKRRKVKRGRVEIIPMIDTIVILLIFYMTFARFAQATREASIQLPNARAGADFKQLPGQVIVNMFSVDNLNIGGEKYTMAELPGPLRGLKAKDPAYAKMSVILRGDKNMTYKDLSEIMRACAAAGIADVTFATLEIR